MPPLKTIDQAASRVFKSLYPRERWLPSEWAERERRLSPEESSEPGPYRFERTPYWRFVGDLIARPGIEEVVCIKGAQIGWSEECRNIIGYWIDMRPDQCLILTADKQSAQAFREERIEPLMKHTPAVARYVSTRAWDTKKTVIRFENQMRLFFAWAGSKTGTKSRPIRYLVCEEPDEYPKFSSSGGDPLSKAEKRLTTYRDKGLSRILIGGTPTTRLGNIHKRWEMCAVRYHLWVPCPHCGGFQLLQWKQVKFSPALAGEDKAHHAERVKSDGAAWYECEHCAEKIRDHHKPKMLLDGKWATEDQVVTKDGRVVGPEKEAKRVGVKISGLYSPWATFAQIASEWLESQDDVEKLSDFINQRLAEPFEQQVEAPRSDEFSIKATTAKNMNVAPGMVPSWAGALFMTVDVQQAGMWIAIRAWGYRYRSRLVWYGFVHNFDEVFDIAVNRLWKIEGAGETRANLCLVDSGGGTAQDNKESRTQEVYRFCERAPGFFLPIKGASADQLRTVRASPYAKDANGRAVPLYTLNTDRLKDELMRLVRTPVGTEGEWELHGETEAEYLRQMTSEHKIRLPNGDLKWSQRGHAANHLWDCEVYQIAAADPDMGGVGRLLSPEELRKAQQANAHSSEYANPLNYRGRW